MRNDEPDAIDRVLEEALSRYSSEEPLAGLEQRVLNRVRAEGARPRHWLGRWVFVAGAVVAASLAFMAIVWVRPIPDPARVIEPIAKAEPRMAALPPLRERHTRPRLARRREFPTSRCSTRERLDLATRSSPTAAAFWASPR